MTRASQLRELNDEELAHHLAEVREELFSLALPVGDGQAGQLGTHRARAPRGRPRAYPPARAPGHGRASRWPVPWREAAQTEGG